MVFFSRMQPRRFFSRVLLVAIICLGALVALLTFRLKDAPQAGPAPALPEANVAVASKPAPIAEVPAVPPVAGTVENPLADVPTPDAPASPGIEQSIQRIEAAVVTYEAASLPAIAPYLTDPNPELRTAAREGLLQMGLSEAVPLLREAAGKMKDPREAILLLDAADFLELPSVSSTAGKKHRPHPSSTGTPPAKASDRR